jgi:cyclohexanone monooxygenase
MKRDDIPTPAGVLDAVVVGAGFSGLYAIHLLHKQGLSLRAFEAGSGVGGTWFWNRYPGARCDIESLEYSYSFSDELQQQWHWPERYAAQPDILRYIEHVADRFDLRRHITLNTRVTGMAYDDGSGLWTVTTDTGETVRSRFCVMASGNLSLPRIPDFPGLKTFKGRVYHTGLWPHEPVDFSGQRVGVVGTGSSGIQVIPKVAEQAAHLTVFQRTANFSVPAVNRPMDPEAERARKADYARWRRLALTTGFGIAGYEPPVKTVYEDPPAERDRSYEKQWGVGGNIAFLSAYKDMLTDATANETAGDFVRRKIRSIVRDPATAEMLCPNDHLIGTKRLCLDTSYFDTFNRPNVKLADVRKDPIVTVTPTGVKTQKAEYALDTLVFATGYDAMTGALKEMNIRGSGGLRLNDKWRNGPRAYLGLMVAGFPNLFLITGPGSPSVKTNMLCHIEQHVDWVAGCIRWLRQRGIARIEARADLEDQWVAHVAEVANATLYPTANSWYTGANIEGKPRVFMPYVGGLGKYKDICDRVAQGGYQEFDMAEKPAASLAPR